MPRRNAPEFSYDPNTRLYRKQIKNPVTGKWIPVYGHTKKELREKVRLRAAKLDEEAAAIREGRRPIVREYAETWFQLNTHGLSQKRLEDYRRAIDLRICPVIGDMCIAAVKPDDVRRCLLASADMSQSLQQKLVTTLKRIFAAAEENGLIEKNPCGNIKAGGRKPSEKVALTAAQCAVLLDAVKGTRAELFVLIGLYAGLRREELCALQWDCVHLDTDVPYIAVRRALRWENDSRPIISETLKSPRARRDVPIAPQLLEPLRAAREHAVGAFVIPGADGGAMSLASVKTLWKIIETRSTGTVRKKGKNGKIAETEKKLGDKVTRHKVYITIDFPVTPHILRHTFITNLILSGANVKTVQYLAGHATAQMTLNIYTHLMESQPRDTLAAISAAYGAPALACDLASNSLENGQNSEAK